MPSSSIRRWHLALTRLSATPSLARLRNRTRLTPRRDLRPMKTRRMRMRMRMIRPHPLAKNVADATQTASGRAPRNARPNRRLRIRRPRGGQRGNHFTRTRPLHNQEAMKGEGTPVPWWTAPRKKLSHHSRSRKNWQNLKLNTYKIIEATLVCSSGGDFSPYLDYRCMCLTGCNFSFIQPTVI